MSEFEAENGVAQEDAQKEGIERSKQFLDPWLRLEGKRPNSLPQMLARNLTRSFRKHQPPRQRAETAAVTASLDAIVEAIITNLLFAARRGDDPPRVAVSLRAASRLRTRYDCREFSMLPRVLETLQADPDMAKLFTLHKSKRRGVASTLEATPFFCAFAREDIVRLDRFYREPGGEVISLSRTTIDHYLNKRETEPVDYVDTMESHHYRFQTRSINAALMVPRLSVEDDGPEVPTGLRELRRHFKLLPHDPEGTSRFDQGGRLFGGWWQGLPRSRRHAIRIDGEPVADLDFSNMFLRLAYLRANVEPPGGDLYADIPGFSDPHFRPAMKVVVNAMLFRDTPLKRPPNADEVKERLPPYITGAELRSAIMLSHPDLADVFETGCGFRLMFQESQILVGVLEALRDQNIPALPMHDGLMCPASKAYEVAKIMGDIAEKRLDYRLPVVRKSMSEA